MFRDNPFTSVTAVVPISVMRLYIVLMIVAVVVGTLFDIYHKGSGKFFSLRRERSRAFAQRELGITGTAVIAIRTFAEAAVSGEFAKWKRRISHLFMMYGFILYVAATAVMVFAYPEGDTPSLLPAMWDIGALMILIGGLWFFLFLRANVAYDGDPPFHVGPADLFLLLLMGSAAFALIWHLVQSTLESPGVNLLLFSIYVVITTLLFLSVPWSKFAHMFYKPAVAFQRKVEEADGSSDLPSPASDSEIRR